MSCDPKFNDVVLLLSMDGTDGGTTFVDSSLSANVITANGDAQLEQSSPQPKFGSASGLFDGSGDYLSMPITPDLDLSSGAPFTLEGWFLLPSVASSTSQLLLGCRDMTNTSGFTLSCRPDTGLFSFQMFGTGGASCNVSGAVAAGNWYHFALVWDGAFFRLYFNGVGGTPVSAGPAFSPFSTAELRVGADVFSGITGNYWPGSLDEFRITNGTARYLGNFVPASEAFPIITCEPVTCDDYYDQLGVLLPLTGPNAGTTFGDDGPDALTVTPTGDVQTSNAVGNPWGAGSAALFGASVGSLDMPIAANGSLDISGDFTIDLWFRISTSGTALGRVLADYGDFQAGTGLRIHTHATAGVVDYIRCQPGSSYSGWTPIDWDLTSLTPGVWYLVSVERRGHEARIYVNGVLDQNVFNWTGEFTPGATLRLGNEMSTPVVEPLPWLGSLADFRVTNSIPRYVGGRFDPPADYYPPGQCAVACDPGYGSTTGLAQIDGGAFVIQGGTGAVNIVGPGGVSSAHFMPPNSLSLATLGNFGHQTRYVEIADSTTPGAFDVAANQDFTAEAWVYCAPGFTQFGTLLSGALDQGTSGYWAMQVQANGTIYTHGTNLSFVASASGVFNFNAWNHVAINRTGDFVRSYVNGVQVTNASGSTGVLTSQSGGVGRFRAGCDVNPAASDNGDLTLFVTGMRFTKGVGRYPGPFVPPPVPFPDFVCAVLCDDQFANVSTLLDMDGTNGSTTFTDQSNNALTWTAAGTAAVETATKRFGTGALNPGNSHVRSPIIADGPLDIHNSDFTLEFWAYWNSLSLLGVLNYGNALGAQGFRIYMNGGGLACQMLMGSWNTPNFPSNMVTGQWYHIAIVRKGGELRAFGNGAGGNIVGAVGAPTLAGNVDIGENQFGPMDGFIDEFRLTKGVARYWDNFMPPQQPFGLVCIGTVPVPDVSGDTLAAATVSIEAVGLVAGTVTYEFDSGTPINLVVETSPIAGTDVLLGSTVDIVLSLGTETTVPNLVGLDVTDATAALTTAGLVLGVITAGYSDTYPVDIIISQDPIAGTSLGEGESVDVVRSLGPTPVEVPNVVTFPFASAAAALAAAGLIVGAVSQAFSEEIELGAVVSQAPSPGATVPPGSAVDLVTSLGPAVVSVPDVLGLTASDASDVLRGAGLRVGVITVDTSGTFPIGTIAAEEPNAGALVPGGTKINLVLSAIAPPFDVDATVISQYQQSPTLVQMVEDFAVYIDPRTNLTLFYSLVWNVDTAQGFGLDVWGKIVGVSRLLRIVADDPKFGFDNADTPPPDWEPFGQGRFARGGEDGEAVILPDDAYRILILTKALANIASTSAAAINQLLRNLFPGRGKAFVEDLGGMSMRFVFEFALTPVEYAIVSQSGALPHPAGVSLSVSVPP